MTSLDPPEVPETLLKGSDVGAAICGGPWTDDTHAGDLRRPLAVGAARSGQETKGEPCQEDGPRQCRAGTATVKDVRPARRGSRR